MKSELGISHRSLSDILSWHFLRGTEEEHEKSQDSLYSGRNFNRSAFEFKSRALAVDQPVLWLIIVFAISRDAVTRDGFWIDDWIWYSAWLHFTVHYYTHKVVSTDTSSPLLGNGFQRRTFSLPLGSRSMPSLSYKFPTAAAHSNLTHSPTNWLHSINSISWLLTNLFCA
jgi:hypothetical protein